MAKNHGLSMKKSKKMFTKGAVKVKTINSNPPIMRGGVRL